MSLIRLHFLFSSGLGVGVGVGFGEGVDGPSITRPTAATALAAQRRQVMTGQYITSVIIILHRVNS